MSGLRELSRGYLIAIEGIDGSGKTTMARMLRDELEKMGYPVSLFHEPTHGRWGKRIRSLMHATTPSSASLEFRLFYLDRRDDVRRNIIPALKERRVVIMDRYYPSSVAYQGAAGMDAEYIERENRAFCPEPDLMFILDLPEGEALKRMRRSGGSATDIFESRIGRVREIFQTFFGKRANVLIVNASMSKKELFKVLLCGALRIIQLEPSKSPP